MADALPPLQMDYNDAGAPVVIVGEKTEVTDPADILTAVPGLGDPAVVTAYAQLVNHLAQGDRFILIRDPAAYEAEYMEIYNSEDPEEEPRAGVHRLHHFGIPDFARITRPRTEDGALVFYAQNAYMRLPYRAVYRPGGQVEYTPVAMKN